MKKTAELLAWKALKKHFPGSNPAVSYVHYFLNSIFNILIDLCFVYDSQELLFRCKLCCLLLWRHNQ